MTSADGPRIFKTPFSNQITSWHMFCILASEWLTTMMVFPSRLNSSIFSELLRWKAWSPTPSTSSMSNTSGSTWVAIEKPSRTVIPDEKFLTGVSIKRSKPANSTMLSNCWVMSLCDIPKIAPFKKTFSRPDSSGWKPAPSSNNPAIFPRTAIRPRSGR